MQLCCIFNNLLSSSIKDMSDTKNAFLRYQVLDECFSNTHRKYFLDDLIKICSEKLSDFYGYEVSISKRTIQYDIEFMMGSGGNFAPIEKCRDGRKTYYRYSDPKYSFMKKDLDAAELEILRDALITMSRIKGLPGFDWMNEMQIQLETALQIDMSKTKIIGFEGNDYLKGIEHLHPLYRSIINQSVLKINYHPFIKQNAEVCIVSPYYLKEYNSRWFLLGWNHDEEYLQTMALDRILEVSEGKKEYKKPQIDFENYFNEVVGVTNKTDEMVEDVIIQVSDDIVPYLETKPLHPEQWLEKNILTLKVKLNYELESLILSFGEKMKVLSPESFVKKIKFRLKENLEKY